MSTAEELRPESDESFDLKKVTNPDGSYNPSLAIILEFGRKAKQNSGDVDADEAHKLQENLRQFDTDGRDQENGSTPLTTD